MNNTGVSQHLQRFETVLSNALNLSDIPATRIKQAMNYALFPGGKRLRPMLVYLCGELLGVSANVLDSIAVSLELTHCYSLVHDDLPAMDNDDYRRGKLSCHRAFDEATAILVGDGMQALAIDHLLSELPLHVPLSNVITITHELIKACGPSGMVSGQSLDLSELTNISLNETQLSEIHTLKTGKLFTACVTMVLAAKPMAHAPTESLRQFISYFGLVFQMQDDYLDQYACLETLGKNRASDAANHKITFATLYSKTELHHLITQHYQKARHALSFFDERADGLRELIDTLQQKLAE